MTAATTAVMAQRQRIIRRFKETGATAPQRAIDPATHHIRQSLIFNQLVKDKVLVKVETHLFYLDEARASETHNQRLQLLFIILMVIAIAVMLYFFMDWLGT
jgi:hypothetical protein